jgi:hypothetical protein
MPEEAIVLLKRGCLKWACMGLPEEAVRVPEEDMDIN